MSSGLPVVATRVGGTPEIVDASAGELVEASSAAALADGIARVIEDRDRFDPEVMHRMADKPVRLCCGGADWTDIYEAAIRAG